jgi:hypothetical protein
MPIAPTMTAYITSNFITGDSLEKNVRVEATIVGVREHEFKIDDVKPTVDLDDGRRVALNQTRLKSLIGGFGPNPANWIGKKIIVSRGSATFGGNPKACVVVEPVVPRRIVAGPKPAIAAQPVPKGLATIEGGLSADSESPREQAPPVQSEADYGGCDPDDDIPF